jgi:type VI secretion system protein ImpL
VFSSFRRFVGIFINRTTLTILLLLVLSLVIWFIGPIFAMSLSGAQWQPLGPEWVRWSVIAAIWLFWLIKRLIHWWRQRNINGALLGQLAKMQATPVEGQAAGSEEVAELNKRFKEAADVLKKTRFSVDREKWPAGRSVQAVRLPVAVVRLHWCARVRQDHGAGQRRPDVSAG